MTFGLSLQQILLYAQHIAQNTNEQPTWEHKGLLDIQRYSSDTERY